MPKTPTPAMLRRFAACATALGLSVALSGCGSPTPVASLPSAAIVTITAPAKTVTAEGTAPAETVTAEITVTSVSTVVAAPQTSAATSTKATGTQPSTSAGLKLGGAGITESDDSGGASISALSVQRKATGTGTYSVAPKNGNYVLIDVSYTCTSGKFNYNPYDWTIRDADGRTYDVSGGILSGYADQALHSGTLAKGAKARGTLIVDAPKGALSLEYSGSYNSAPATWTIPA